MRFGPFLGLAILLIILWVGGFVVFHGGGGCRVALDSPPDEGRRDQNIFWIIAASFMLHWR